MTEDDLKIIQRVVEARHTLALSQVKFAEKIKISKGYMASIEMGIRRINDRILKIISMTFGVNETWLKTGTGSMFDQVEDFKLTQVVSIFKTLDPSFQDYVIKQLNILLELQGIKINPLSEPPPAEHTKRIAGLLEGAAPETDPEAAPPGLRQELKARLEQGLAKVIDDIFK
ncbi:hypothetical protein FACS1894109_00320 [Spirochaetia bacterium]|nr:hypothetical protein FACS1894109_00320 [Spirochaetia bacterium]